MSNRGEGSPSGSRRKKCKCGLEERVCKALRANRSVDASEIGVQVRGKSGELILVGMVPSDEQRRLAEICARSVRGVKAVDNRLKVVRGGWKSR